MICLAQPKSYFSITSIPVHSNMETMKKSQVGPFTLAQQELKRKQISPPVLKLREFPIALLCAHQQLHLTAKSDTNLTLGKALSAEGSLLPLCLQALQPLTVCSFLSKSFKSQGEQ